MGGKRGTGAGKAKTSVLQFPFRAQYKRMTPAEALERMDGYLKAQINLCCQLEEIADGLPDNIDTQNCLHIARSIYPTVRRAHEFEETELFPLLKHRFAMDTDLLEALNRLHFEHWEDESYAEELSDGLMNFVAHRQTANPEALAYMLRGFFDGVRRHIAFEREHLCPLVRTMEAAG